MNTRQNTLYVHLTRLLSLCMLLFVFTLLSACGSSSLISQQSTANAATSQTLAVTTSQTAADFPIKVFFSKFPDSIDTNFNTVFPVNRVAPTTAVGTYAIQMLIAGPTLDERSVGYFSELNSMLSGPSTCSAPHPVGGPDFTLTLNKKGSKSENGTATLQFCRTITSSGIGTDARVQAEINATLKQFATIQKVVILTTGGHCFGDESGLDQCLK